METNRLPDEGNDAPRTPANTCPEDDCHVVSPTPEGVVGHVQRNHAKK
jgi:hypothetical protein